MVGKALAVWQEAGEELMTPSSVFPRGALRANTRPVQGSLLSDVWLPVCTLAQPVHPCYRYMVPCDELPTPLSAGLNSSVNIVVLVWAGELNNLLDGVGWRFSCHMGSPPCMVSTVWSNKWGLPCQDDTSHGHTVKRWKSSEICWQMWMESCLVSSVCVCACERASMHVFQITFLGQIWGLWSTQAFPGEACIFWCPTRTLAGVTGRC